ncbi:Invasin domain protein, partial [hydrothermal vent metagenome]
MATFFKWMSLIPLVFLAGCPAPSDSAKENEVGGALEPGMNLRMFISSTGEQTTDIPTNDDAKVDMVFLDAGMRPLDKQLINVSATSGTLSQASVLTDQNGEATVTINPPDFTAGSAPGLFTATPNSVSEGVEESEENKDINEVVYKAKTLTYQFIASAAAETPEEAAGFATSLQFISAQPTFLSLKGTGGVGYGEISKLVFKVVDNEGAPVPNVNVEFKLTTTVGGLSLNSDEAISNNQGEVFVTVLAGTISTPVRVTATVEKEDGSLLSIQSDLLTVTTGIPDQNSFSLALEKFAPEGLNQDNEKVNVSVLLADRFNNPVPDGTVVNFTTEGGSIESSCQVASGGCTVVWTSQNPRPLDHRATILAYAVGHETYYDKNGSGIFDDGDTFDDLGEAFRDDDETKTYNPDSLVSPVSTVSFSQDEKLIDYDVSFDYTERDGVYNGVPCNHSTDCPNEANNIADRSNLLVNVRRSALLIMASGWPMVHLYEVLDGSANCLNGNGKLMIDDVQCRLVNSLDFSTGFDSKHFWGMIEDSDD